MAEVSAQSLLAAGRYGSGGARCGDFIGIAGVRYQILAGAGGLDDGPSGEGPVVGKSVAGDLAVESHAERRRGESLLVGEGFHLRNDIVRHDFGQAEGAGSGGGALDGDLIGRYAYLGDRGGIRGP